MDDTDDTDDTLEPNDYGDAIADVFDDWLAGLTLADRHAGWRGEPFGDRSANYVSRSIKQ